MGKRKMTPAKRAADRRYLDKFSPIRVLIYPEEKEVWLLHTAETGESMTSFVRRAVREQIKRDAEGISGSGEV